MKKKLFIAGIALFVLVMLVPVIRKKGYIYGKKIWHKATKKKQLKRDEGAYVWGIDISHHQGNIDWGLMVKHNRPSFVFIKCTEGATYQDGRYENYRTAARKFGLLTGAYHFFSYQSSGKAQALNFIRKARLKKGDLYPVLDIEYKRKRPGNSEIRRQVRAFCRQIKKEYGVNPIIYCEYAYYRNILKREFKGFNYWISDMYREPVMDYVFWQYTDRGYVKGAGKIDKNRLNRNKKLEDYTLKK